MQGSVKATFPTSCDMSGSSRRNDTQSRPKSSDYFLCRQCACTVITVVRAFLVQSPSRGQRHAAEQRRIQDRRNQVRQPLQRKAVRAGTRSSAAEPMTFALRYSFTQTTAPSGACSAARCCTGSASPQRTARDLLQRMVFKATSG